MGDNQKAPSGIPDNVKIIGLVAFLAVVFIVNQIFYSPGKKENENIDPNNNEHQQTDYVRDNVDVENEIEQQLEQQRIDNIIANLGIEDYDRVTFEGDLADGSTYIVARSGATEIGQGYINYLMNTGDSEQVKEISWTESNFTYETDVNDPIQLAAHFADMMINHPNIQTAEERRQYFDVLSSHIKDELKTVLADPLMPIMEARIIGNVELRLNNDEVIARIILADDIHDDHVDNYTYFQVFVQYDTENGLWQVVDMDLRRDGDMGGLQNSY